VGSTFEKYFLWGLLNKNCLTNFLKIVVFSNKQNMNMFILRKLMFIFLDVENEFLYIYIEVILRSSFGHF
jgi:hypothetical protein